MPPARPVRRDGSEQPTSGFLSWPRWGRWATYAAVGLVLLLVATFVAGVVVVRHSFPETDGDLALPGLESR